MSDPGLPAGLPAVAVAGAVASLEEAAQVNQMRFILTWAIHLEEVASQGAPQPPAAHPGIVAVPPM